MLKTFFDLFVVGYIFFAAGFGACLWFFKYKGVNMIVDAIETRFYERVSETLEILEKDAER